VRRCRNGRGLNVAAGALAALKNSRAEAVAATGHEGNALTSGFAIRSFLAKAASDASSRAAGLLAGLGSAVTEPSLRLFFIEINSQYVGIILD
jgi:hypothetical protein